MKTDAFRDLCLNINYSAVSINFRLFYFFKAEDGAVEWDLPTLEAHEAISRYGFNDLALVQVKTSKVLPDYSIKITLPDGTFTVLQVVILFSTARHVSSSVFSVAKKINYEK